LFSDAEKLVGKVSDDEAAVACDVPEEGTVNCGSFLLLLGDGDDELLEFTGTVELFTDGLVAATLLQDITNLNSKEERVITLGHWKANSVYLVPFL
jgi:hypothetical protein